MSSTHKYQPFDSFVFDDLHCFLTGKVLQIDDGMIPVFPQWLMNRYGLDEKPFKRLDESVINYKRLVVPCNLDIYTNFILPLDSQMESAFNKGYKAVKEVPELDIFKWVGRIIYGIVFHELQTAKKQLRAGENLNIAPSLLVKYTNIHLLLQSFWQTIVLEDFTPWSIVIREVEKSSVDELEYRDEINTCIFSICLNGVGLIVCLQDNGNNKRYNNKILTGTKNKKLHPIQFEELCAKFYYSAYLFNRLPQYIAIPPTEQSEFLTISDMSMVGAIQKSMFDDWQNKTYAQVLEAFWKKWGFSLFEILKNPDKPMSFLEDEQGNFIEHTSVKLP